MFSTTTQPVPPDSCCVSSDQAKEPFTQEVLISSITPTSRKRWDGCLWLCDFSDRGQGSKGGTMFQITVNIPGGYSKGLTGRRVICAYSFFFEIGSSYVVEAGLAYVAQPGLNLWWFSCVSLPSAGVLQQAWPKASVHQLPLLWLTKHKALGSRLTFS